MTALVTVILTVLTVLTPASGPPFDVPPAALAASLSCHGTLSAGTVGPVLLIPGTTLEPKANFDWNYEPALAAAGIGYCAVTLPDHGMSDIQTAAEYVVYALRTMRAQAGRAVDVVGYSQGGMISRWTLKYWPDTRADVSDVIGIDPSNHGTLDAVPLCAPVCAASIWQQRVGSAFLTALNAGQETYPGIDYTVVYSLEDEVVFPNFGPAALSTLHTGPGAIANIAVQQICPLDLADHVTMGTTDPVGYAVVMDALTHAGPASASRVSRSVCLRQLMPAVNPFTLAANELRVGAEAASSLATAPILAHEPALKPYA
jgi:pimeloyl-ACP methyl ester carboxylesterase